MTRIDFYILQAKSEADRLHFAARLCEKAFKQNLRVLILTDNAETASELDQLLWFFKPDAFIPHSLTGLNLAEPVLISAGEDDPSQHELLINLSFAVPAMFSRFQRLAEIVVQTPETLAATRTQFAYYRDRGYPVATHPIP